MRHRVSATDLLLEHAPEPRPFSTHISIVSTLQTSYNRRYHNRLQSSSISTIAPGLLQIRHGIPTHQSLAQFLEQSMPHLSVA